MCIKIMMLKSAVMQHKYFYGTQMCLFYIEYYKNNETTSFHRSYHQVTLKIIK